MPHHIEIVVESELLVHWTEDQPSIKAVKNHFVRNGVVSDLVSVLIADESRTVARKEETLNGRQYMCEVKLWPVEHPNKNDPNFVIGIGYDVRNMLWDAVGYAYKSPFPGWLSEEARSIYALNMITLLKQAVVAKQQPRV